MASTVDQVVAKFRAGGFYPDCTDGIARSLFTDALKWLTLRLRLRTAVVSIDLAVGTREYDLPSGVVAVREAYYEPSATASEWSALKATTVDELARLDVGWRTQTTKGTPQRFYVDQASDTDSGKWVIGFTPIPAVTTSGGYPRVRLYCVQTAELSGAETMPLGIFTDDVLLYEMAFRWAARQDPQRAPFWNELRERELADTSNMIRSISDDAPATVFLPPFVNKTTKPA